MSTGRSHPAGRAGREGPSGNYRFPAQSDRIDVDAFLGTLAESDGSTPDLSASILSRVHARRPFVNERARLVRRAIRAAAAAALCIGTLAFGGWLMDGGLDTLAPRRGPTMTDAGASTAFVSALGRPAATGSGATSPDAALRITSATSSALAGFMRTTVPAQERASTLADLLAITAPMPASGLPAAAPTQPGQTFASAALRWTQSVLPAMAEDEINEADLADQFDRAFRGSRLESGTAGVYNPR